MVRDSESKLVSRLLTFEFFQGAAIAIFYQVALTIFIHDSKKPTRELPVVYVISGIIIWLTGYLYHKLEHKLPIKKLVLTVLLTNTILILLFSIFLPIGEHNEYFLFAFLASYNALYLLNNLEFWGVASLLFDVRQSKRLFTIVSSGDIPAKLIGFILVTGISLAHSFSLSRLLWISLAFILVSLYFYFPLMRLPEISNIQSDESHGHHHDSHGQHHESNAKPKKTPAYIAGDLMIRNLALVSLFAMCCLILVNYVLYAKVKTSFEDDTTLMFTIGAFLVISRSITLVVKLAITNRILEKFGLKWTLLLPPLVLLLLTGGGLYFIPRSGAHSLLYAFGMIAITVDILHSAILLPVLLACMQPLPTQQRLRGHTIIKGFMDPFAYLAMGVMLLLLVPKSGELNFIIINFILIAFAICWIYLTFSVEREYMKTLTANLHDRTLQGVTIELTDATSLDILLKRIDTANEIDAIGVLNLILTQPVDKKPFIARAMAHPSQEVRKYALFMITQEQSDQYLPMLREMLGTEKEGGILASLVQTISVMEPEEDLSTFLDHPHNEVAREALLACLHHPGQPDREEAIKRVEAMLQSTLPETKMDALWLAGKWKDGHLRERIKMMMEDEDSNVRRGAMKAAVERRDPELIERLVYNLFQGIYEDEALNAVIQVGESQLPVLKHYLWSHNLEGNLSRKIIQRLGKMEGTLVGPFLEDTLTSYPAKSQLLLPVILQRKDKMEHGDYAIYLRSIQENLHHAGALLYEIDYLQQHNGDALLIRALELEMDMIRAKCLGLFSFIYDEEKIRRARHGLESGSKEAFANALELIGMTVPPEFANIFSLIYERSSVKDKCLHLHSKIETPKIKEGALVTNILYDIGFHYDNWTKSCALYSLRESGESRNREIILPFASNENPLVKETAEYILSLDTI